MMTTHPAKIQAIASRYPVSSAQPFKPEAAHDNSAKIAGALQIQNAVRARVKRKFLIHGPPKKMK